jgi:vacuolar-type H+-ATPase subunit H
MDDILKRMLAVEREADNLVTSARLEAKVILEEARRKANEILADAQVALATEVETLVKEKVATAENNKVASLQEADRKMEEKVAEFRKAVNSHLQETVQALLFPTP